jgi:hypothetical protein
VVALLHALLAWGLWHLQGGQHSGPAPADEGPLMVWLPGAPRAPAASPTPATALAPAPALAQSPRIRPEPAVRHAAPQAISLPAPAQTTAPSPPAAASAPPTPAPAGPTALNLSLPRRSAPQGPDTGWESPAELHRRPAPPTLESRIAAALGGSDQITEFRLQDGSVRLQRGNSCVIVRPSRDGLLDPFNAAAQARPRLVDRC